MINEQYPQDAIDFLTVYKESTPIVQNTLRYMLFSGNSFEEISDEDLFSVHYLLRATTQLVEKEITKRASLEGKNTTTQDLATKK